jgi:predicted GNAT family N-acyltransferase
MEALLNQTEIYRSELRGEGETAMTNGGPSVRGPSLVAPMPAPPPATAPPQTTCEIRALESAAELIESYRLRHDVYRSLGYINHFNRSKLEIDPYDSLSVPFGAFASESGTMIGTLRLVTTEPQPAYESLIQGILDELGDEDLTRQARAPWPYPLPSIISREVDRQIAVFNTERFVVQELSRTIVRPGHRGMGVSRGLVELGMAYASRFEPSVVVGGCVPEHLPMYAKYGCHQLPHTDLGLFESVGQIAYTVIGRTDVLPQPARDHVDELLRSMSSGATECTLEISRDSRARFCFATPRRARRRTMEW